MVTFSDTNRTFAETCWTFGGIDNCEATPGYWIDGKWYDDEWYPYSQRKEEKEKQKIQLEIVKIEKTEDELEETIDLAVNLIVEKWKPKILRLDYKESKLRYREYLKEQLRKIKEDELAIILILLNL